MRVNFPGRVPIPKPEDKSMAAAVAPTKSATLKEAEPMLQALGLQSQSCTCTSTSWQEQAALRCDAEAKRLRDMEHNTAEQSPVLAPLSVLAAWYESEARLLRKLTND